MNRSEEADAEVKGSVEFRTACCQSAVCMRPLLYDGIVRGHTALQLRLDGRWVDVDATFDRPLKTAGFVVTEEWDGRSSMPLVVTPLTRVESPEPPAYEEALLGIRHRTRLSRNSVERINGWLDQLRLTQKEARRVAPA